MSPIVARARTPKRNAVAGAFLAFLGVGSLWRVHTHDGAYCGTTFSPKKLIVISNPTQVGGVPGVSDACDGPITSVQGWQFLSTIGGGIAGYAVARAQQTQRANRARPSSTDAT